MENVKEQFEFQVGSIVSVNRFYTQTDLIEKFVGQNVIQSKKSMSLL